jgi:beta-glucosidase
MKIPPILLISLFRLFALAFSVKIDQDDKDRAKALAGQMTLKEKIAMLHGKKGTYIGNIPGNERLGIPPVYMNDGPQGFRTTPTTGPPGSTTAWPSALTAAASWDTNLVYRWAAAVGVEFKGKGADIDLAPGMNLARVPRNGRNFEYCGEDPILCAQVASAIVRGIQDQGVMATAKHWVNNEQETNRKSSSSDVDERTRYELYYPPFAACIEAGVLTVMCAYNRVNRVGACENSETINGDLKSMLEFDGWVMSDWLADHHSTSTDAMLNAGLDTEMPQGIYFSEKMILKALDEGNITEDTITRAVERALTAMYAIGMFDQSV